MHIHVLGCTSYVGGADTELWHALRLWRANGVDVDIIPTWSVDREQRSRLESLGLSLHEVGSVDELRGVPTLTRSRHSRIAMAKNS